MDLYLQYSEKTNLANEKIWICVYCWCGFSLKRGNMFFPSGFLEMDTINITHDIFYYFLFHHCVIHLIINLTFLHLIFKFGKVTIKGQIQKKQAVQRGTFLNIPEAIDQEISVTHCLVTLPKKTIKAFCARCRKDFTRAIFLSMDFYFLSLDHSLWNIFMFSKSNSSESWWSMPNIFFNTKGFKRTLH